jgi:formamidopyrimidine-DNA glycosylase
VPELPEVETVRRGLDRWAVGRTIAEVEVHGPRTVRRHPAGPADFAARLRGRRIESACRRGKYLWLRLDDGASLLAHLGMSGQFLAVPPGTEDPKHLRARFRFRDDGPELRFVDQRTFGGLALDDAGGGVPAPVAHIALDPLDEAFDDTAFADRLRRRHTGIKRALLDQTLISGIGNIYADESLWRARLHGERAGSALTRPVVGDLLAHVRAVLGDAIRAGGTSFDALYVNVNGQSGYFDRSLAVYGQEGRPCPRCGTPIRRASFMNRSSFFCPRCQRAPRRPPGGAPQVAPTLRTQAPPTGAAS